LARSMPGVAPGIRAVVLNGKLLERSLLDKMLAEVQALAGQ
jgi:hypothetical protein